MNPAPFFNTPLRVPSHVHQHFSPPQDQAHGQMTMDDLLQVVPQLISRIESLDMDLKQTKRTIGNALVKLVKKVKKLEGYLKRRNVVLSDLREEESEASGEGKVKLILCFFGNKDWLTPSTSKTNMDGGPEDELGEVSTGRVAFNSVKFNVNTSRKNVNPVRLRVNTGSSNVNTVRSRQPVPTKTSNSFSPKRPQGTAVKTSAGYNWRKTRPNSNYDSRSNFVKTVYFRDPQGRLKSAMAWVPKDVETNSMSYI
ncbi:hypothetical protein Tco_1484577 [Tanacetum coccineum]